MKNSIIYLPLILIVFGCGTFKTETKEENKDFVENLPGNYLNPSNGANISSNGWWHIFGSEELNNLVTIGFTNNLDLANAWTRLRLADSLARKANSSKYPDVNLGANAAYIDEENGRDNNENYGISLAAAYEVDLWGKIRATSKSKNLETMATAENVKATALLLSGSIANTWLNIKSSQARLNLLNQQVKANTKTLDLLESRWRVSLAAAVDVFQQEQILAQSKSLVPQAKQEIAIYKQQLAYLLGYTPETKIEISDDGLPPLPELPSTGVPANLLENRPDVKAAWIRVQSQDWNVVAAKADRLPSISLTGSVGYNETDLNNLFDNWILNLAAGLVAPIIDGGRRRAEVSYQEALTDQSFIEYKDTVLTALKEVENALTKNLYQKQYLAEIEIQEKFADKTLTEAAQRYQKGVTDYLPVLSALNSKQNLERSIISVEENLLLNRVSLYQALGGNIPITN